ncbi:unnamed protein product [Trichobilharzia regenti]|nr:unnamed protein product [Trichobilharzia regenti]
MNIGLVIHLVIVICLLTQFIIYPSLTEDVVRRDPFRKYSANDTHHLTRHLRSSPGRRYPYHRLARNRLNQTNRFSKFKPISIEHRLNLSYRNNSTHNNHNIHERLVNAKDYFIPESIIFEPEKDLAQLYPQSYWLDPCKASKFSSQYALIFILLKTDVSP